MASLSSSFVNKVARQITRNLITILSIDGGGIRGIIPGKILHALETQLQKLDGPDACVADYFDVVAGTSSGGLVAAMLTSPDSNGRPIFAAKDIVPFYLKHGPKIFPYKWCVLGSAGNMMKQWRRPKYDGKYLHKLIRDRLGQTRLRQALTSVVIPTFDIKNMQPVIFSSYEVSHTDALLSDICIATSAAPTYLPAHHFKISDDSGWDFNLVDGCIAANNPTLVAIAEVMKMKHVPRNDRGFFPRQPTDYSKFLVISLGTGSAKHNYTAEKAAKWGLYGWLNPGGNSKPIIEVFSQASQDMVDYFLSVVFQEIHCEDNYLRIQFDSLCGDNSSVDVTTKENLNDLVRIGGNLLADPVSRVNLQSGHHEAIPNGGTNEEALRKFAKLLSDEQKLRRSNCEQKSR